jgi:UDP-N-acetylmuramoyl-L-alanyl-D-glutamate--2,6-diaminopimelate ligase
MGKISEQYADMMIVTDDDPDIENRLDIISQVLSDIKRREGDGLYIIPEREFAIKLSTQIAQPGDTVLMT